MIVATRKHIGELQDTLKDYESVLVLGCGTCVAVCLAGGEREVGIIASALRIAFRLEGLDIEVNEHTLERQCDDIFFEDSVEVITSADAVLSLACGAGVQATAERFPETPVFPGVDTQFIGILEEQGVWAEKCIGCGNCIVGEFGGICPITRCPKRLLNGPCGGVYDGKCEFDGETDCVWSLIYERLKTLNELYRLDVVHPPIDWSKTNSGGVRVIVREDQRI